jgi:hypothetical protein
MRLTIDLCKLRHVPAPQLQLLLTKAKSAKLNENCIWKTYLDFGPKAPPFLPEVWFSSPEPHA